MLRAALLTLAITAAASVGCVAAPLATAPADGAYVVVRADDLFYDPSHIRVPEGAAVTVHLVNDGAIRHDLVLDTGQHSGDLLPGESTTFTIGPLTTSTAAWCSIPGHRDAGMVLDIVVEGASG